MKITIEHVDQIRDAIKDEEFFELYDKGSFYLAKYVVSGGFKTIFDDTLDEDEINRRKLLRECRGIMFDKSSGKVICRPMQKFFNYGEMEEPFDVKSSHVILNKLDGSMISPFVLPHHGLVYGTKAGVSDVSKMVTSYVNSGNKKYNDFSEYLISSGYTPCFEYCSPDNQIVIMYDKPELTFLCARHMVSGEYLDINETQELCSKFNIPHVTTYGQVHDIDSFIENVRTLKNVEGFVVRFHDGFSQKFKADDYIAAHNVVTDTMAERRMFQYAFNDTIDDLYPVMPEGHKKRLEEFHKQYSEILNRKIREISSFVTNYKNTDKKMFYDMVKDKPLAKAYMRIFSMDKPTYDDIKKQIVQIWEKNMFKQKQIRDNRYMIDNLKWEVPFITDEEEG